MPVSKKEAILQTLENVIRSIQFGNSPTGNPTYKFENTVTYVDRQYFEFEMEDAERHPKPWVIINNEGEEISPLPGKHFEIKLNVQIVGFVEVNGDDGNLDSIMNSLQKDILVAMITDVTLQNTASYIIPREITTVPEMIRPYGGFVIELQIIYNVQGTNF